MPAAGSRRAHRNGPRVVGDGQQYLFCRVDASEDGDDPPERLAFAFRLGGNVYSPGVESAGRLWCAERESDQYDADSGRGWLVFELSAAWRAEHAALLLRGAEWPVDSDIRERLAATPPSLSVDWHVEAATRQRRRDSGSISRATASAPLGSSRR